MAQLYTSHFQYGWYDTQVYISTVVHHPYSYPTSPFPALPRSTWINASQLHGGPPLTNTPQTPKPGSTYNPSSPTPNPEATTPIKRPLRSILKRPRHIPTRSQPPGRKSVRFTPSTASPLIAAPGTYKHTGRPNPPKARHPARSHPCLISTLQQRAQDAMATVSGSTPVSKQVSNTSIPLRVQPCAAGDGVRPRTRPPTPPPAAFFRVSDHIHAQSAAQQLPRQSKKSAPRQPVPIPAPKSQVPTLVRTGLNKQIHIQTRSQIPKPAYSISYAEPYGSDSEDCNTDVWLATELNVKKPQLTQAEVKAMVKTQEEETAATRRSLKALAREFDRKNAWRRGGGLGWRR